MLGCGESLMQFFPFEYVANDDKLIRRPFLALALLLLLVLVPSAYSIHGFTHSFTHDYINERQSTGSAFERESNGRKDGWMVGCE